MNTEVIEHRDKCVYVHKLDGNIVYVGSGSTERVNTKSKRSLEHLAVWYKLEKEILQKDLTETQAKDFEYEIIAKHWDSGLLFNKTRATNKVLGIDWEVFNEYFYYDEAVESCLVRRKHERYNILNKETGCVSNGYFVTSLYKRHYRCHRIIYAIFHKINLPTHLVIDHIDGNRANNKIENLRLVTQSVNSKNRKPSVNSTGIPFVQKCPKCDRFVVDYKVEKERFRKCFSYCRKPNKTSTNHYPTRELALEAAITYRDSLVQQGLIVLT